MSRNSMYRHRNALIAVFCMAVTLAPFEAHAASDPEIEALRKEVADLRARVARLEGDVASGVAVNPARKIRPVEGGWKVAKNWDLLADNMAQFQVEDILGEAESSHRFGKFEIWQYGTGQVKFYLGKVSSWRKP